MPAPKQKQPVDKRSPEEIAYQSAINSNYNTCTPMLDAQYVRISHPVLRKDLHMRTNSEQFYSVFAELVQNGMKEKLIRELTSFGELYDVRWHQVLNAALSSLPAES